MNQFNHKLNVRPLVAMPSDFLISNPKSRILGVQPIKLLGSTYITDILGNFNPLLQLFVSFRLFAIWWNSLIKV